ncbi:MAG: hypothetical protein M3546_11725 [Actinomycetota bacterium]|nr:hypothetical protein [Actinomycetota bacterium]
MDLLGLGSRVSLGLVLILASAPKFAAQDDFTRAVGNYRLLPQALVAPIARLVAPFELAAGLALLVGVVVIPVAAFVGAMFLAFASAVSWNLLRGRRIDCGCAGTAASRTITWPLVVRDLLLATAALALAVVPSIAAPFPFAWPAGADDTFSTRDATAVLFAATLAVITEQLVVDGLRARTAIRRFKEVAAQ